MAKPLTLCFLEMTGVGASETLTDTGFTPCYRRLVLKKCLEVKERKAEGVKYGVSLVQILVTGLREAGLRESG